MTTQSAPERLSHPFEEQTDLCQEVCQECEEKLDYGGRDQSQNITSRCCLDHPRGQALQVYSMLWHARAACKENLHVFDNDVARGLSDRRYFKDKMLTKKGQFMRIEIKRSFERVKREWIYDFLMECQRQRIQYGITNPWNAFRAMFSKFIGPMTVQDVAMAAYTVKLHCFRHVAPFSPRTFVADKASLWSFLPPPPATRPTLPFQIPTNTSSGVRNHGAQSSNQPYSSAPEVTRNLAATSGASEEVLSGMSVTPPESSRKPFPRSNVDDENFLTTLVQEEHDDAIQGSRSQDDSEVDETREAWNAVMYPATTTMDQARQYIIAVLIAVVGIVVFYPTNVSVSAQTNLQ